MVQRVACVWYVCVLHVCMGVCKGLLNFTSILLLCLGERITTWLPQSVHIMTLIAKKIFWLVCFILVVADY